MKSARVARATGLAACCLLLAAGLGGCGGSVSDAVTELKTAGATVVGPGGARHVGVAGERLLVGDSVIASESVAVLQTGGRVTTLAPRARLHLNGRSDYALVSGSVVVDRRRGPDLTLSAGPVTVQDIGRTAVRLQRAFSVRLAVYDGGNATVGAAERTLAVPALHQVVIPGDSLPSTVAPLALDDDQLDRAADPALVTADTALRNRAAGLDGPGGAPVSAALPAFVPTVLPAASVVAASSAPLSERVLPIAIATAAPGDHVQAYDRTRALRGSGGSWGVVAALVGSPVAGVQRQITVIADSATVTGPPASAGPPAAAGVTEAGSPGSVQTLLTGGVHTTPPAAPVTPVAGAAPAPGSGSSGGGSGGSGGSGGTGDGGVASPPPAAAPTPTPTQGLVGGLLDGVTGVLGGLVGGLLGGG
ncbi:MAG TPA: hypothetical protein VHC41_04715 [Mycobacteriales bacterium]|nr:hypothetical protein [Mycobacteriales bacterium]